MRGLFRCWRQVSVIIVSLALFTLSCQDEPEEPKASPIVADRDALNQLVMRYDVPRNFYELFPEHEGAGMRWEPLSVRVTEVLAEIGDQPLLFIVRLDDIVSADSGYTAIFSSGFGFRRDALGAFSGHLWLACSSSQKSKLIREMTGNPLGGFAVVATMDGFRRPRFQAEVSGGAGEYQDYEITLGASAPIILSGHLVEASYLKIGMPVHALGE